MVDWRPRVWIAHRIMRLLWPLLDPALKERRLWHSVHTGRPGRLHIAGTAVLNDTLLNTWSGHITVGDHAFLGYGAKLVAGTHDYRQLRQARIDAIVPEGYDITIGPGVWAGENVVVLGPCNVGHDAVLVAGAVVSKDVQPYAIMGGVPARKIGDVRFGLRQSRV